MSRNNKEDTASSLGRVDTLLEKVFELATHALDAKTGMSGSWDRLGGVVKLVINEHVPKKQIDIPDEAKVLAKLMGWGD